MAQQNKSATNRRKGLATGASRELAAGRCDGAAKRIGDKSSRGARAIGAKRIDNLPRGPKEYRRQIVARGAQWRSQKNLRQIVARGAMAQPKESATNCREGRAMAQPKCFSTV